MVNMPLSQTVQMIRGPKGSTVALEVVPAGATDGSLPKTVSIVRDQVKLEDQEAKARIVDVPTSHGSTVRLGVIDLPSFYADMGGPEAAEHRSATADVARLLGKLKAEHVAGVVLDVRRNGGGSLDEAISLTGLFIRKGPVVLTKGQAGDVEVGADKDPAVLYDGPLVVLTSRFSASATEIMAGALQDFGRALIVGDTSTFGKGTVQSILPLARIMDQMGLAHSYDPGALKVTISKFYRPSGASTQLRGVASDIVLPSTTDRSDVSESSLKDPLPWDVVPSARYTALNLVKPYVSALRDKSARRVAANRDFEFVRGDIARLKGLLATKSVSLNEADRRREMAQDKERDDARELVDRARRAKMPSSYAITLENASAPGLPSPLAAANTATPLSKAGSAANGKSDPSTVQSSLDDDVVLDESERILADYVDLLTRKASRFRDPVSLRAAADGKRPPAHRRSLRRARGSIVRDGRGQSMRTLRLSLVFAGLTLFACHQDESASNAGRETHMGDVHASEPPPVVAAVASAAVASPSSPIAAPGRDAGGVCAGGHLDAPIGVDGAPVHGIFREASRALKARAVALHATPGSLPEQGAMSGSSRSDAASPASRIRRRGATCPWGSNRGPSAEFVRGVA